MQTAFQPISFFLAPSSQLLPEEPGYINSWDLWRFELKLDWFLGILLIAYNSTFSGMLSQLPLTCFPTLLFFSMLTSSPRWEFSSFSFTIVLSPPGAFVLSSFLHHWSEILIQIIIVWANMSGCQGFNMTSGFVTILIQWRAGITYLQDLGYFMQWTQIIILGVAEISSCHYYRWLD